MTTSITISEKELKTDIDSKQYCMSNNFSLNRVYIILSLVGSMFIAVLTVIITLTIWPHICGFQESKNHYNWPPASNSYMAKYKRAAVTCDNGLCSEIGRNILMKGGNAVDAAIASMFCLGVTNPQSSGLGGGFVMTLYNRTTQKCTVIDARETAPHKADKNMFLNDEFGSKYGFRAIATPGELAGYWLAFKDYGSRKVSWFDLVQPSIQLAKDGVPVSEYLADVLVVKEKQFKTLPYMQGWIDNSTKKVFVAGDRIKRLKLASTLQLLAESSDPEELFYRGDMAETIIAEIKQGGGILEKEDLRNFKPVVDHYPLINNHFNGDLIMCGPAPPSSFSITQLIISLMAKFYAPLSNKDELYKSSLFYHRLIEAEKFAYAQRTLMGDPAFVKEAEQLAFKLINETFIDSVYRKLQDKAKESKYYGGTSQAQKEDHGTSHVSVLDEEKNGVSATSTINRWFGSSTESQALGIVWNDEMDDFSTPGMNNGFGFAPSETNFIEPGKKPMSSMSPMIIYSKSTGEPKFVIGASGGSKIISALAKPIIRVMFFNETIKEAIDAPTLHNQFTPDITQYEDSVPEELINDLIWRHDQKFKPTTGFEGIVQAIVVNDKGEIYTNGDYRRKTDMHPGGY